MIDPDWRVLTAPEQHDKKAAALLWDLGRAVANELSRADVNHSQKHNTPHEAYAVILEECLEAKNAMEQIDPAMDTLLTRMMADKNWAFVDAADILKRCALRTAAELIQVAAMCDKAARGFASDDGGKSNV